MVGTYKNHNNLFQVPVCAFNTATLRIRRERIHIIAINDVYYINMKKMNITYHRLRVSNVVFLLLSFCQHSPQIMGNRQQ